MKITIHKKKKLVLTYELVLAIALLFPFLKPNGIVNINPTLSVFYDVLMLGSFLLVVYFFLRKGKIPCPYTIYLTVFIGWIILRTVLTRGTILASISIFLQLVGLALYIEVFASKPLLLIRAFMINLEILIYTNFACLLLYPDGMYISELNGNWNNWLLGYDNHWFIVLFGAMFIAFVYGKYCNRILRPLLLNIVIHISATIITSGVITFGIVLIDFLYIMKIYKRSTFSYKTIWSITLVANLIMLFLTNLGIVSFVMYSVLNRPFSTVIARESIWAKTMEYIHRNPIIGYGRMTAADRVAIYNNHHGVNSHNFILEILFEGGLIGILFFMGVIYSVGKVVNKKKDTYLVKLALISILACLITGTVDSFLEARGYMFFVIFGFCANIETIGIKLDELDVGS